MCKFFFNTRIIWFASPRRSLLNNRTQTRRQVTGLNESAVDDRIGDMENPELQDVRGAVQSKKDVGTRCAGKGPGRQVTVVDVHVFALFSTWESWRQLNWK